MRKICSFFLAIAHKSLIRFQRSNDALSFFLLLLLLSTRRELSKLIELPGRLSS